MLEVLRDIIYNIDNALNIEGVPILHKNMYDFYHEYFQFGDLLVKIELEGILFIRLYLKDIEEQKTPINRFSK